MVDSPVLGDDAVDGSLGRFMDLAKKKASGDRVDHKHLQKGIVKFNGLICCDDEGCIGIEVLEEQTPVAQYLRDSDAHRDGGCRERSETLV